MVSGGLQLDASLLCGSLNRAASRHMEFAQDGVLLCTLRGICLYSVE